MKPCATCPNKIPSNRELDQCRTCRAAKHARLWPDPAINRFNDAPERLKGKFVSRWPQKAQPATPAPIASTPKVVQAEPTASKLFIVTCGNPACGAPVKRYLDKVNKTKTPYCSRACFHATLRRINAHIMATDRLCAHRGCNKPLIRLNAQQRGKKENYCSNMCREKERRLRHYDGVKQQQAS